MRGEEAELGGSPVNVQRSTQISGACPCRGWNTVCESIFESLEQLCFCSVCQRGRNSELACAR